MKRSLRHRVLWLAAVLIALAAAPAAHATSMSASTTAAAVKTRTGKLGTFLVDAKGRTLYLFKQDKTAKSTCSGACAAAWPPLLTGAEPKASGSARSGLLGTTRRSDGTMQVTYKGHPLYRFVKDTRPGDTKGHKLTAFGAAWYAVKPSGGRIGGY
jgi:predicted lipoprotein with Yx(FWY)xxD motif